MNPPSRIVRYRASRCWTDEFVQPLSVWLAPSERLELEQLRHWERRQHWLRGRWLAKQTLSAVVGPASWSEIEILSRGAAGLGLAPEVRVLGRAAAWRLTISHSRRGVLVALAHREHWRVGADLADVTSSSKSFRQLWFTPAEQAWLRIAPRPRTARLWALKESIYKACNDGEPWTPRAIEVLTNADGSHRCTYHGHALAGLQGSVQVIDGQTAAVVYLPVTPTRINHDTFVSPVLCL